MNTITFDIGYMVYDPAIVFFLTFVSLYIIIRMVRRLLP